MTITTGTARRPPPVLQLDRARPRHLRAPADQPVRGPGHAVLGAALRPGAARRRVRRPPLAGARRPQRRVHHRVGLRRAAPRHPQLPGDPASRSSRHGSAATRTAPDRHREPSRSSPRATTRSGRDPHARSTRSASSSTSCWKAWRRRSGRRSRCSTAWRLGRLRHRDRRVPWRGPPALARARPVAPPPRPRRARRCSATRWSRCTSASTRSSASTSTPPGPEPRPSSTCPTACSRTTTATTSSTRPCEGSTSPCSPPVDAGWRTKVARQAFSRVPSRLSPAPPAVTASAALRRRIDAAPPPVSVEPGASADRRWYQVPNNAGISAMRFNLVGREGQGLVRSDEVGPAHRGAPRGVARHHQRRHGPSCHRARLHRRGRRPRALRRRPRSPTSSWSGTAASRSSGSGHR